MAGEVLKLQYNASAATLLVSVQAVKEVTEAGEEEGSKGHAVGAMAPQLGKPDRVASLSIEELPSKLQKDFRDLLAALSTIVEAKAAQAAADPEALIAKAADLAAREHALKEERAQFEASKAPK